MTNASKTTTPKKKKTATAGNQKAAASETVPMFNKGSWLALSIGALIPACIYVFATTASSWRYISAPFYSVFWLPPLPALLIALFGSGYLYKTLRCQPIEMLARVIAYILLVVFAVFILFAATVIGGKGSICTSIMGSQVDCSEANALWLYLLFGNPFSLMLLSALAITGGVALLKIPKR